MDHGRAIELQGVAAQRQAVAFLDHQAAILIGCAEEILHHVEGLVRSNHCDLGIGFQEIVDVCGVVRLHMLYDQIVRLPISQLPLEIIQPQVKEFGVHRIKDGNLFIQDRIGIVSHAIGHRVLALKQVDLVVIDAQIADIACNCCAHNCSSLLDVFTSSLQAPEDFRRSLQSPPPGSDSPAA